MPLSSGDQIAHYKIVSLIGKGGMGEVYKALDAKLDRDVAMKVLPAAFASDPGRLARFEREAKVLASLNHSGIAAIHGVEDRALVMELVPGPTLQERIKQGGIPPDETLDILLQITEALEYAHDKGIVHRDLKPANIKINPEDKVKILDFGLAKAFGDPLAGLSDDPDNSPTVTIGGTIAGTILGTAAYMAPEQARGKKVDRRADIWAFGVVVWEMLTGERLFRGETTVEVLGKVLEQPVDLDRVPEKFRKLLSRCLDRNVKDRLRDIGEARFLLNETPAREVVALESTPPETRTGRLPWITAALATVAALALGYVAYRHATEEPPRLLRFAVPPPGKTVFKMDGTLASVPAVSPDGRRLAFVATADGKDSLWVRDLDSMAARELPGTDGALDPFWSPDSRVIAFFAGGKLKKIEVAGGPALSLCDTLASPRGGTWNQDDVIVFATSSFNGLYRVAAAGGSATPLTELDQTVPENSHRFPWFLPDGRHFLYLARNGADPAKDGVWVGDLDSKTRRRVGAISSNAVYVAGYLLFLRDQTLMAQRFDPTKAMATGDAAPIAERVGYIFANRQAEFSASKNGVLVYAADSFGGAYQLTWLDRSGKALGTLGAPGVLSRPAISPDGKTVAVDRTDSGSTSDV